METVIVQINPLSYIVGSVIMVAAGLSKVKLLGECYNGYSIIADPDTFIYLRTENLKQICNLTS